MSTHRPAPPPRIRYIPQRLPAPATSHLRQVTRPAAPRSTPVLLDRLVLRFVEPIDLGLTEPYANPADGHPLLPLLQSLAEDGLCDEPSGVLPSRIKQRINMLVDVPGGGRVHVGGDLTFSFIRQLGWAVNANSLLWCNGMEFLRSRLPDGGDSLGLSLDGSTNWIGRADEGWHALAVAQSDGVAHALFSAWARVRARLGLGNNVSPIVALRDVEACHDLFTPNATPLTASLQGTYPNGSQFVAQTFYAAVQINGLWSRGVSVRWTSSASGEFALKAYTKRPSLLRLEVAASKGRGVRKLLEAAPQDQTRAVRLSTQFLADLLRRVLAGAAVHVGALRDHINEVRFDDGLWADLLEGLAPLLSVRGAPTPSRPGAPVAETTLALARDALMGLLFTGAVRPLTATGKLVPKGNPVRKALEVMARPEGVLVFRPGYRRQFVLRPKFAGSRARVVAALLPTWPGQLAAE